MFEFNTFIRMVRFILWLDWDRDEDPRFHLINLGCMELFSIHDCMHMILSSRMVASMPWIHTYDPF